jgi:hypothetical protein
LDHEVRVECVHDGQTLAAGTAKPPLGPNRRPGSAGRRAPARSPSRPAYWSSSDTLAAGHDLSRSSEDHGSGT